MPEEEDELAKILADPKKLAVIKEYNRAKGKRGAKKGASAGGKARAEKISAEQRKADSAKGGKKSKRTKKKPVDSKGT